MQKLLLGLFGIAFCFSTEVSAQNFTYSNVELKTVTFSGGNLNIRKDDGTGSFGTPHWNTTGTENPVAYVSGNAPTVAATFTIDCATVPDSIWVRGTGSDAMDFTAKKVNITAGSGSINNFSYPATVGSHVFSASIVRFFKPYSIDWEVSFDEGTTWKLIGTSENTMYVTRGTPQSESGEYKWFQTVYDLSCRNAEFKTTDTDIIAEVWDEFVDHVVLNCDGDSLFYYKAMNSPNVTLSSLLKFKDAECYTFAQLFLSCIKIQGVVRTNNYVYITPIGNTVCGYTVNRFLVKDWSFGTPTASAECSLFPWKNTYDAWTGSIPSPYTAYVFMTSDVTDQTGIPGSCTANPASYFNNHQIALIDGVYYDACYGVTFSSLSAIKTAAFSGWSFRYTDWFAGVVNAYFTNDMSLSDLDETITTF